MGTIVCRSCDAVLQTFPAEKVTTLYSFCDSHCKSRNSSAVSIKR
ncbi:GapA-binding peptide SR1P [Gracilibacillus sp. YIM 98692]|nr:GapA-binding peptide SR1P [Gracilibacillus sp. YIM 98692]